MVVRKGLAGVLALLLLTAGKCENVSEKPGDFKAPIETPEEKGSPVPKKQCDPKRVPGDKPSLQQKRYITIYGCVEEGFQPIELMTSVRDNDTGQYGEHTEPSANREVHYIIGYDSGHYVTLHVELKPSRVGSQEGFLYVSDGVGNRKTVPIDGAWRALADFEAKR